MRPTPLRAAAEIGSPQRLLRPCGLPTLPFLLVPGGPCALEVDGAVFLKPIQLFRGQVLPDFAGFELLHLAFLSHFLYAVCMKQTKPSRLSARKKQKKKMGRPATGFDPSISVRVPQEVLDQIMRWAKENGYTRSVAVVGLLMRGLGTLKDE